MSFFVYLRVELRRIFCSKITWLIMLLSTLVPLAGYFFYKPAGDIMKSAAYIANPALAGAIGGAFLFALLSLYELDRVHRNRTAVITDCIVSPLRLNTVRVLSVIAVAILSGVIISIVYLPYTVFVMGTVFQISLYLKCIWLIMVPAFIIAVLATSASYQVLQRVDVSFILFLVFAYFSMSGLMLKSYILRWINPTIFILSDDFGNTYVLLMVLYNRIFWMLVLGGIWIISLICVRRYGKGLIGSLLHNSKKFFVPVTAVLMLIGGGGVFYFQQFVDHSPLEINDDAYEDITAAQDVDLISTYTTIIPNTLTGKQHGTETFQLENCSGTEQECAVTINPGYKILRFKANGKPIDYTDLNDDNLNYKHIKFTLPSDKDIELVIEFDGFPQIWSIVESYPGSTEVSNDYVFLVNQDFAPVIELYGSEENIADITLPSNLIPVTNGESIEVLRENDDETITWRSKGDDMIWHLYAAEYDVKHIEAAGTELDFYYSAKHKAAMERVNISDTLKEVFEYCSKHYGAFPFITSENPFKLVELTAYMSGGFAIDGMSVMDESCFSEEGLNDPLKGTAGNEVMAHEIIHQWWGLGRMFAWEEGSEWSSEGLTVYTTYRMMKEKYGDEYAKTYYVDVWQKQVDDYYQDFYYRHPEYFEILPETYQAEIKNAETTVLQYCVMPLKLFKAETLVGGQEKMDEILANIFQHPKDETQPELTYQEFLDACGLTEEDLNLD